MPTLLENVAQTAHLRQAVEHDFRTALVAAREKHSWAEIAQAAGMKPSGVRWLVDAHNQKGENKP